MTKFFSKLQIMRLNIIQLYIYTEIIMNDDDDDDDNMVILIEKNGEKNWIY